MLVPPPYTALLTDREISLLLCPSSVPISAQEALADRVVWRSPSWQDHWVHLRQAWITGLPLLIADLLSAGAAYAAACGVLAALGFTELPPLGLGLAGLLLLCIFANWSLGLYPGTGLSATEELRATSYAVLLSHVGLAMAICAHSAAAALTVAGSTLLALAGMPLARRTARNIAARFSAWGQRVVMFGDRGDAQVIYRAMLANPQQGLRPVGIVDLPLERWRIDRPELEHARGDLSEASYRARHGNVAWGIVPIDRWEGERTMRHLDMVASIVPHLILVLPKWGEAGRQVKGAHCIGDFPALRVDERLSLPLHAMTKRAMDLLLLALGSAFAIPLIALLAIHVRISSTGPVFYCQERLGRGGRKFNAWKLRSMVQNADQVLEQYLTDYPELRAEWQRDHKLKNDPRITKIGRFLRKTSLDELPQLWNVLRGEMSLVGPRPIVEAEVPKYSHFYSLYTRVRPGITGLWQVSGRNNTTYETRIALDAKYVRTWSLWLDIYLLARTVKVVLKCEGAY